MPSHGGLSGRFSCLVDLSLCTSSNIASVYQTDSLPRTHHRGDQEEQETRYNYCRQRVPLKMEIIIIARGGLWWAFMLSRAAAAAELLSLSEMMRSSGGPLACLACFFLGPLKLGGAKVFLKITSTIQLSGRIEARFAGRLDQIEQ